MNKILKPIVPCAIMAAIGLIGCYSQILPDPPQTRRGVLPVAGAPNARDLGGIPGYRGGTVRWGLLVRSGELDMLTPGGRDFLFGSGGGRMGIGTVVDFRSAALRLDFGDGDLEVADTSSERTRAPSRMPGNLLWQGDTGISERMTLDDIIWRQGIDFDHIVRDLTQWYRDLVTYHRDQYLEFFEALLDANGPVLFHCSTGKDRTGVAAALLLMALGVSDVDIVANYILSKDLVYEKLFPVVPFVRGEMVRDMQERRSDALILVNTPDQDGPILERLQSAARRDVLRRWMQGEFSRIIDGLSPEDAIREAKEAMDEIVAGLDDEDPALQDIRDDIELTFEGYRDWMMELGQIPDDDFDDWMENFAWNAGNNIKPTLSVFRQWIEVALAEVRAGGGIEEFLDDYERFGMSGEAVVARLRELYLEPGQGSVQ